MTSIVETVRQPEYTGENRCMPCTIANTVIAAALSVALAAALVLGAGVSTAGGAGAGVGLFAVCMLAIYLRGYLVPKTPELTKKYFPERVLAWFDQLPEDHATGADAEESDLDPEVALQTAGAVEPCVHEEDLCLSDGFHEAWHERATTVREDGIETDDILAALDMTDLSGEASLNQFGDAVVLERSSQEVGKWESQAALVADVAAARELEERYRPWAELDGVDRSRLLRGLRIFLEECPLCDGPISLGQETVESCCRSYDVVAVTCGDCGARLFEQRWDGPPDTGTESESGGERAGSASPT